MRAGASEAGGGASDSAAIRPRAEAAASGRAIETIEPGSFRDRNGAVFYRDGEVFRGLSARALRNWERLRGEPFFRDLVARGAVVASEQVDGPIEVGRDGTWAAVLRHARIPFVSYPYEWPFGMLKDAALLHLEIMAAALEAGMILKDSSAYNVQWKGARPVFIDIPSFEILPEGQPWVGYRQFCELFLYPLMLQAYKGVDFRPWLRGSIDGIPAHALRRLMSARDLLRPGVLMHVVAQDTLQRRYSASQRNLRSSLAEAGFDKRLIARNVAKLARIVAGLSAGGSATVWSDYDKTHSYDDADLAAKCAFVSDVAATRRWRLVWDLGCNTGTFSRIVAEHADDVVAMDGDWMAIERLYREQTSRPDRERILPLVVNLADPSPGQGWLGRERRSLPDRTRPDLTLCLALIHHIVIGANIPMRDFIAWLASLGTSLVIEFVSREDEMVQTLLRNKDDQYADYQPEVFETALAEHFEIVDQRPLKGGKRSIYFARRSGHYHHLPV
jgi:hypothetical protein